MRKTLAVSCLLLAVLLGACSASDETAAETALVLSETDQGRPCVQVPIDAGEDIGLGGLRSPTILATGTTTWLASPMGELSKPVQQGDGGVGVSAESFERVGGQTEASAFNLITSYDEVALVPNLAALGAKTLFLNPDDQFSTSVRPMIEWDDGAITPWAWCFVVSNFENEVEVFSSVHQAESADVVRSFMGLDGSNPKLMGEYRLWLAGSPFAGPSWEERAPEDRSLLDDDVSGQVAGSVYMQDLLVEFPEDWVQAFSSDEYGVYSVCANTPVARSTCVLSDSYGKSGHGDGMLIPLALSTELAPDHLITLHLVKGMLGEGQRWDDTIIASVTLLELRPILFDVEPTAWMVVQGPVPEIGEDGTISVAPTVTEIETLTPSGLLETPRGHACLPDPADMADVELSFPSDMAYLDRLVTLRVSGLEAISPEDAAMAVDTAEMAIPAKETWTYGVDTLQLGGPVDYEDRPFRVLLATIAYWPQLQADGAGHLMLVITQPFDRVAGTIIVWADGTVTPLEICASVLHWEGRLASFRSDTGYRGTDLELVESMLKVEGSDPSLGAALLDWADMG